MSKTIPIRGKNAISEIAFVVLFEKELDDKTLLKLTALEDELSSDLPEFEVTTIVKMLVGPQSPQMPVSKPGGVVCSKKADADPSRLEWSVRVEANNIIVACSEYTNWKDVWEKSKGFLFSALDKFDLKENPAIELVFQCTDKFTFDEDISKYQIGEVFDLESDYLTRKVTAKNRDAWHIHQGWFEFPSNETRALHNLNLNAHKQDKNQSHETAINHLVKVRMTDGSSVNSRDVLCGNDREIGYLENVMIAAHESNKNVLLNLLNDDMSKAIGLKG